jgi:hypothetical protein
MDEFELPTPPPLPPGPVPMIWEYRSADGLERERHHRLAVLHGACPRCADRPGELTARDWLSELAQPRPFGTARVDRPLWVTPEGELASFVHGRLRVDDPTAFRAWAFRNFAIVGDAFAHLVDVEGSPWTRAMFWLAQDGRLHLEAASFERYLHLEFLFEQLWPPVFRGSRIGAALDDRFDESFRPLYPRPPAEASVFTRLTRVLPAAEPDQQHR